MYERLWQRLLDFLNDWSTAVETGPGRIQVTVAKPDGSSQVVEIVMTPDDWDSLVSVIGDFESQTQRIRQTCSVCVSMNGSWCTGSTSRSIRDSGTAG